LIPVGVIEIGYETEFYGELKLNKPLDTKTFKYLKQISEGEHEKLDGMPKWWCPWNPEDEETIIADDGKAYDAEEWLTYIIEHILKPKGYILNGEVEWSGDESDDRGRYVVTNNKVKTQVAKIIYEDA